jgi:hypothetical protein
VSTTALLDELRAVTAYIGEAIPDCQTALTHPTRPVSGLIVVRHDGVNAEQVASGALEFSRTLNVVVYHESEESTITRMDALHHSIANTSRATNAKAVVRFTSLTFGAPVKLDGGLFALMGIMKIHSYERTERAKTYGTEPLIAGVHATIST